MLVEKGLEQRFRAFFKFLDDLGHGAPAAIKFAVGTRKGLDPFLGEIFRMQAQSVQVEPSKTNGITRSFGARGNVAVHLVRAAHKSVGADLIALLDSGNAADSRIFADAHVAAQLATVCDNDPCSNIAVMGDMRIGHN